MADLSPDTSVPQDTNPWADIAWPAVDGGLDDPVWVVIPDPPPGCALERAQHPERIHVVDVESCGAGCTRERLVDRRWRFRLGWGTEGIPTPVTWRTQGHSYSLVDGADDLPGETLHGLMREDGVLVFATRASYQPSWHCDAVGFAMGDGFGAFELGWVDTCDLGACPPHQNEWRIYHAPIGDLRSAATPAIRTDDRTLALGPVSSAGLLMGDMRGCSAWLDGVWRVVPCTRLLVGDMPIGDPYGPCARPWQALDDTTIVGALIGAWPSSYVWAAPIRRPCAVVQLPLPAVPWGTATGAAGMSAGDGHAALGEIAAGTSLSDPRLAAVWSIDMTTRELRRWPVPGLPRGTPIGVSTTELIVATSDRSEQLIYRVDLSTIPIVP